MTAVRHAPDYHLLKLLAHVFQRPVLDGHFEGTGIVTQNGSVLRFVRTAKAVPERILKKNFPEISSCTSRH